LFSQLPYEFVRFTSETLVADTLPKWLPELLHYEWVELEVDLDEGSSIPDDKNKDLYLNETAKLLSYNWPVHTISKASLPDEPVPTFLVVYRDYHFKVRFLELNATTMMLLQYIESNPASCSTIISGFLETLQHPEPETLVGFAKDMLIDLKKQEVIFGEIE
jgi:hypothetical protein